MSTPSGKQDTAERRFAPSGVAATLVACAALALLSPSPAFAQEGEDDATMGVARQMLRTGASIPPEAKAYLDAHPELKEKLLDGAKKQASEEGGAGKGSGRSAAAKSEKAAPPPGPRYDWRVSPYLNGLFGRRLSAEEKAVVGHFGHDLFQPREGGAAVLEDMPVAPGYVVGPGDQIIVKSWGRLEGSNKLVVDRDGKIFFPKLGPLAVAGRTFSEVRAMLAAKVAQVEGTQVEVSLGELKASRVSVVGEVRVPGWYDVSSLHTALQALYLAGGVQDIGSMRKIELRRDGRAPQKIDLYDLLLRGDNRSDLRLLQGDTLFVPVAGRLVAVAGDVRRPAIYELADEKSLAQAVQLAGGFAPSAWTRRIQVERLEAHDATVVLDIDASQLGSDKGAKAFELMDGDLIRVLPIVEDGGDVLTVEGNVRRPGRYQVKPGLTIGTLFPDEKAFLPETWFDYALLTRLTGPDLHKEMVAVNLREIVLERKTEKDLPLRGRDTLKIFPRSAFQDSRKVSISGEVRMAAPPPPPEREAARAEGLQAMDRHARPAWLRDARTATSRSATEDAEDDALEQKMAARGAAARELQGPVKDERALLGPAAAKSGLKPSEEAAMEKRLAERKAADAQPAAGADRPLPVEPGSNVLTFEIPDGARLSDVITLAGGLTRNALMTRAEIVRLDKQRELQTIYLDLAKVLAGDPAANIALEDEDKIRIHSVWEVKRRELVSIAGEVQDPGDYQLTAGMKLSDLVFKAGGFRASAFTAQAELVRRELLPDGSLLRTLTLPVALGRALEGEPSADLPLQKGDQLVVRQIPDWMARIQVKLSGEVRFPGLYSVPKGERLSSVVARAGGFTKDAYPRAAHFARESTRVAQQAAIDKLTEELEISLSEKAQEQRAAFDKEDLEYNQQQLAVRHSLIQQLRKAKATGRVIISLPEVANGGLKPGSAADLLLEDGDRLEVPKQMNVVNVVGRVYNPTGVVFDPQNPKAGHYLSAVGGPMESADDDHIFVIRADGSVAVGAGFFGRSVSSVELQPGDSVVVPERLAQSRWLKDVKDITQIAFQIAVTAAVVLKLF
jgi:protein involved in polysaccharide export with SLBB domain